MLKSRNTKLKWAECIFYPMNAKMRSLKRIIHRFSTTQSKIKEIRNRRLNRFLHASN